MRCADAIARTTRRSTLPFSAMTRQILRETERPPWAGPVEILRMSSSLKHLLALAPLAAATTPQEGRNVLLIVVDDLRPQLNVPYGFSETITPSIDALAESASSVTFLNAYCQMAVCSPSRNSFMTGRRPDTTRVWNFIDSFRDKTVGADWTTMPGYFKQNGYFTTGAGKLFHPGSPKNNDYPTSWTEDKEVRDYYWGNGGPIGDAGCCVQARCNARNNLSLPLKDSYNSVMVCVDPDNKAALDNMDNSSAPQNADTAQYDHRLATRTVESLRRAKSLGKNFFVTVGFRRPHLEWLVPQQFWDMYAEQADKLSLAKHQTIGENITTLAYEMNGGMGQNYTTPEGKKYQESPDGPPLPEDLQRTLRRGYYAAVSFLDFEVGRVLSELNALGLADNTAVVLMADHGWKLGEHGDWSKCTNWETDARVPLIIRAPWIRPNLVSTDADSHTTTRAIVELVDIFPTVVELAGLPAVPTSEGLEGKSLVPVLSNPTGNLPEFKAAFSQYPRCPSFNPIWAATKYECLQTPKAEIELMGYSVRVDNARYTEWRKWEKTCVPDWSEEGLVAQELYDHTGDMGMGPESIDNYEYVNMAYKPERAQQVTELGAMLKNQFYDTEPRC